MIPNTSFDILVAGEINPDLVLTGDVTPEFGQVEKLVNSAVLTIGSSSAIFACGAARLGLKVAFIGVCGEDVFGRFMLDEMHKRDVDISNVMVRPDGQTGLSVILSRRTDRAILTNAGLIAALQVLAALVETSKRASEICRVFEPLPQMLRNVRFAGASALETRQVKQAIAAGKERLGNAGRLVIRKSGTEPVVRVMAQGEDGRLLGGVVDDICEAILSSSHRGAPDVSAARRSGS